MQRMRLLAATVAAIVALPWAVAAQAPPKFEQFTGTTTNLEIGNGEPVKFDVSTWTAAADREKVVAALEKGEEQLLEALKAAPSHGYIWTSETIGYTLRYAHREPLGNGGERIVLATDRPLGVWSRPQWKAAGATAATPALTVIELRLNRQGRGNGKLSLAAKPGVDRAGGTIALENYDAAPVGLKDVSRVEQGT